MMIPWVIQNNVGPEDDVNFYWDALKQRGNPRHKVHVSPFTDQVQLAGVLQYLKTQNPDIKEDAPVVWMGGVGFLESLRKTGYWNKWIFTDPTEFNLRRYSEKWGALMLNSEGAFTTMGEFLSLPGPPDELVFVRPIKDLKEFPGNVIERINLRRWVSTITGRGFKLDESCEIYVGPPHGISHEWRMFMLEGKVITGSYYTSEKYAPEGYTPPPEGVKYAEDCASIWSPAPIFCLDVCKTAGNLFIMEAGSFHSAGLYRSSAALVVDAVSNYFETLA